MNNTNGGANKEGNQMLKDNKSLNKTKGDN